jgi:hypothetical protein
LRTPSFVNLIILYLTITKANCYKPVCRGARSVRLASYAGFEGLIGSRSGHEYQEGDGEPGVRIYLPVLLAPPKMPVFQPFSTGGTKGVLFLVLSQREGRRKAMV